MKAELTKDELDTVLTSWHTVNKAMSGLSEQDVKNALNRELVGNRRKDVTKRLHQRYTKLRAQREFTELMNTLEDTPVFLKPVYQV